MAVVVQKLEGNAIPEKHREAGREVVWLVSLGADDVEYCYTEADRNGAVARFEAKLQDQLELKKLKPEKHQHHHSTDEFSM